MTSRIIVKFKAGGVGLFSSGSSGMDIEVVTDADPGRPKRFSSAMVVLTASATAIVGALRPSDAIESPSQPDGPGTDPGAAEGQPEPARADSLPEPDIAPGFDAAEDEAL